MAAPQLCTSTCPDVLFVIVLPGSINCGVLHVAMASAVPVAAMCCSWCRLLSCVCRSLSCVLQPARARSRCMHAMGLLAAWRLKAVPAGS